MIDLNQYKPVPHAFRAVFRKHKVANATVANYLGVAYAYFCSMLGGQIKMPQHIEEKLQVLVDQLEACNVATVQ